jgi:diacylglycerol kinase (ATP)
MMHLVVNPIAGRGRGLPRLERVVRGLEQAGVGVQVHRTTRRRHATELVLGLPDGAVPVAVGGDGTIHEVALASLQRGFTMGIVPTGSGDDFAFAWGIDRFDLDAAIRTLAEGHDRPVDVGMVNGEPFLNGFGTGFDADVARRIEHAPTVYRGLGRYLYGIVTAMRDFAVRDVWVSVDGREVHAGPGLFVGVQNGPRAGGSFLFTPGARPDDGVLDVIFAGRFGRLGTLAILPRVMRATHLSHPRVHTYQGHEVQVRWSTPVVAHVDGEDLGDHASAFEVGLRAGALRVLAPAARAAPPSQAAPPARAAPGAGTAPG